MHVQLLIANFGEGISYIKAAYLNIFKDNLFDKNCVGQNLTGKAMAHLSSGTPSSSG
jgi:hypothetical protein